MIIKILVIIMIHIENLSSLYEYVHVKNLYRLCTKYIMSEPCPLYVALRFDKDDALRNLIAGSYSIDYCLHIEDCPEILRDDPALISIAAFFGSENCFTYLNIMGCDMNQTDKKGVYFISYFF